MQQRKTIFITGASRGIGLALAGKFLSKGHEVYAAARHPDGARELWELERDYGKRFHIVEMDVTHESQIERAAASLKGQSIDVLINNAGVMTEYGAGFADVSVDGLLKAFTVNTMGPMRVTQLLLPNLQAAAQPIVANITSKMGSIADNTSGGSYAYRISKAALNMMTKSFAIDFPDITSVLLHPGWVKTDMGGAAAPTSVEESAAGLAEVISKLTPKDSGHFYDFRGQEIPW